MKNGHKEREVAGEGFEHNIFWTSPDRRWVKKLPRRLNYASMAGLNRSHAIKNEVSQAQELVEGTAVKLPITHVHRLNGGYIIHQQWNEEDNSVSNVREHLTQEGLQTLVDEHKHESLNFVSQEGVVYWVDPTKGVAGRFLERLGVNSNSFRAIKAKLHNPIRLLEKVLPVYKHKKV